MAKTQAEYLKEEMGVQFPAVELSEDEYQVWLADPTTRKVLQLAKNEQIRVCLQIGAGSTLASDPGETQKLTAQNVGLVEGIAWPFDIPFESEEENEQTDKDDIES